MTNWLLDAEPAPQLLVLPPDVASLDEAHAAIELWEHYSGKRLDPTQQLVVEVLMAQRSDGSWAAATTGREMPRQNGKGDELEVVELWGLVQRAEAILHTVHDAVMLATQAQQRMLSVLEGHADLRRRVKRVWRGTGQQMIEMRNGGVIWYRTRTGGAARGVDMVDRLVVDEAQHATLEHLESVSPTLLAASDPQLNAVGTAGIAGRSDWWWTIRRRALEPAPGSFGYVGHTAEVGLRLDEFGRVVQPEVNVEDRALWRATNPAAHHGRGGGMAFLEEQFRRLTPDGFAREHLCVWDPPPAAGGLSEVDLEAWAELADVDAGRDESGRPVDPVFAVGVTPDRKWTMVGVAARRHDGAVHLQIAESQRGSSWLADWMVERVDRWDPLAVVIDPASPAGSLVPELAAAGVDVAKITGREYAAACGALWDGIVDRRVRHQDQPLLNISVRAAGRHTRGDAWVWQSNDPHTDITALQVVTLAYFGLLRPSAKKKRTGKVWAL